MSIALKPARATAERERDVRMLASLVASLRGLSAFAPGEGAGAASEGGEHAADIAAYRKERAALWQATEAGVALMRDLAATYAGMLKTEARLAWQRDDHRDQERKADELRVELARRIKGFVDAREQEKRGGE